MSCLIGLFTTAFILAILALLDRKLDCQPSPQGFSLREWAKKPWGAGDEIYYLRTVQEKPSSSISYLVCYTK